MVLRAVTHAAFDAGGCVPCYHCWRTRLTVNVILPPLHIVMNAKAVLLTLVHVPVDGGGLLQGPPHSCWLHGQVSPKGGHTSTGRPHTKLTAAAQ